MSKVKTEDLSWVPALMQQRANNKLASCFDSILPHLTGQMRKSVVRALRYKLKQALVQDVSEGFTRQMLVEKYKITSKTIDRIFHLREKK